jgi:CRISPR-associated protein Csx10
MARDVYWLEATLQAPVVISSNRQSDRSEWLDHIPGTTVRGALAQAFLRLGRSADEPAFSTLFLDESSARWPTLRAGRYLAPATATSCKRHPGFDAHGVFDVLVAQLLGEDDPTCPACGEDLKRYGGVFEVEGGQPNDARVDRELTMHVGIDRATGTASPGVLFGLEGMAARRRDRSRVRLSGAVELSEPAQVALDELLGHLGGIVYVGKARTRGRGRVELKVGGGVVPPDGAALDTFSADFKGLLGSSVDTSDHEYFTIGLPQGAVLLDPLLRFSNDLAAAVDWLPPLPTGPDSPWAKDGIEVVTARTTLTTLRGWSAVHGLPRVDDLAIAPGSVYVYRADSARWGGVKKMLLGLASTGVGVRRSEGLGQVALCDRFHLDRAYRPGLSCTGAENKEDDDMLSMDTRRKVDLLLEAESPSALQLGETLAKGLKKSDEAFMTQLRGLEVVAYSSRRLSDVEDYLMNRMGRDTKGRSVWNKKGQFGDSGGRFGDAVLDKIGDLRTRAAGVKEDQRHDVAVELARGWVRRLVSSCLYHLNKS